MRKKKAAAKVPVAPRRSKRSGVKKAKARAKAYVDYLDAPDSKVLSMALPPVNESPISAKYFNMAKDRLKPQKRKILASLRGKRQNELQHAPVEGNTKHILFLNVGDARILEAIIWLSEGGPRPPWTNNVGGYPLSPVGRKASALRSQRRKAAHGETRVF